MYYSIEYISTYLLPLFQKKNRRKCKIINQFSMTQHHTHSTKRIAYYTMKKLIYKLVHLKSYTKYCTKKKGINSIFYLFVLLCYFTIQYIVLYQNLRPMAILEEALRIFSFNDKSPTGPPHTTLITLGYLV